MARFVVSTLPCACLGRGSGSGSEVSQSHQKQNLHFGSPRNQRQNKLASYVSYQNEEALFDIETFLSLFQDHETKFYFFSTKLL